MPSATAAAPPLDGAQPILSLRAAADDVTAAVAEGAFGIGEDHGLPMHHYPLERTAEAHAAVEDGAVGKVLISL